MVKEKPLPRPADAHAIPGIRRRETSSADRGADQRGQIRPADIQKVLEVAGQLFAEDGFEGVGIRRIAELSGVSMPSIFYHFGSKASLYEEVLEYKYEATTAMVLQSINSLDGPKEKLECLIGAFFDLLIRDRTFLLLVHRNIGDVVARKSQPIFVNEYSYVFSVFCRLLEAALGRPVDTRVAFSLVSLMMGFCELTAMLSGSQQHANGEANWYAEQRSELITVGMRICLI